MKRIYWKAITGDERIKAVSEMADIINRHAIILDSRKISDLSLGL